MNAALNTMLLNDNVIILQMLNSRAAAYNLHINNRKFWFWIELNLNIFSGRAK